MGLSSPLLMDGDLVAEIDIVREFYQLHKYVRWSASQVCHIFLNILWNHMLNLRWNKSSSAKISWSVDWVVALLWDRHLRLFHHDPPNFCWNKLPCRAESKCLISGELKRLKRHSGNRLKHYGLFQQGETGRKS